MAEAQLGPRPDTPTPMYSTIGAYEWQLQLHKRTINTLRSENERLLAIIQDLQTQVHALDQMARQVTSIQNAYDVHAASREKYIEQLIALLDQQSSEISILESAVAARAKRPRFDIKDQTAKYSAPRVKRPRKMKSVLAEPVEE